MNPLVRLGVMLGSLPIFNVKDNYETIRDVEEQLAPTPEAGEHDDFILFDRYLLADGQPHAIPIRIFVPKTTLKPGLILFYHGGGFVTGNIDTYSAPCADLASATGRVVASVEYRLAPEHPFPAGLEDCYVVAEEILDFVYGAEPEPEAEFVKAEQVPPGLSLEAVRQALSPVILMGDSAGANLATVVARKLAENGLRTADLEILLYPAVGGDYSADSPYPSVHEKGDSYGLTRQKMLDYYELYLPDQALLTDPDVAPVWSPHLNLLPPSLIITAEHDPLRDEGVHYRDLLEHHGVACPYFCVPSVPHGFFTRKAIFPEANQMTLQLATNFIDQWLEQQTGHAAATADLEQLASPLLEALDPTLPAAAQAPGSGASASDAVDATDATDATDAADAADATDLDPLGHIPR